MDVSRREFLVRSSGLLASVAFVGGGRAAGAQEAGVVRHAVIGMGGQGRNLAKTFDAFPDCEVIAVCDVDPVRRQQAVDELGRGDEVAATEDFRAIIDDETIHAVAIATPDHWHTPIALAALAAGKHVYVEKPCSHNVREGVLLTDAAEKTGLCVQHGTQSRSGAGIRKAIDSLLSGELGKVRMAKAINHQLRGPIGRAEETDPPEGVNYDLWLGPAPKRPFTANHWHYNWHWMWDTGTGDIGNDGVHQIDVARWGLGVGLPGAVSASGGQLFYNDDHETPDTQVVTFEYGDCYLLYEMRLWTDYFQEGFDNAVIFYGDRGTMDISRFGCHVTFIGEERRPFSEGGDLTAHVRNFLDCVRAGDPSGLNAPISEGAQSSALSHLGNIATRVGKRIRFDADRMRCDADDANELLSRKYRRGYELPRV